MGALPRQTQGIIAAGLLSVLTVATFARSQHSGPESVVIRYHAALTEGDAATVAVLILQEPQSPATRSLNGQMAALLRTTRGFKIASVSHSGREAKVEVLYESTTYGTVLVRFSLVKPRDTWQVDADRTKGLVRRARF